MTKKRVFGESVSPPLLKYFTPIYAALHRASGELLGRLRITGLASPSCPPLSSLMGLFDDASIEWYGEHDYYKIILQRYSLILTIFV